MLFLRDQTWNRNIWERRVLTKQSRLSHKFSGILNMESIHWKPWNGHLGIFKSTERITSPPHLPTPSPPPPYPNTLGLYLPASQLIQLVSYQAQQSHLQIYYVLSANLRHAKTKQDPICVWARAGVPLVCMHMFNVYIYIYIYSCTLWQESLSW